MSTSITELINHLRGIVEEAKVGDDGQATWDTVIAGFSALAEAGLLEAGEVKSVFDELEAIDPKERTELASFLAADISSRQ